MEPYTFKTLAISQKEFEAKHRFWTMYREWLVKTLDWEECDFSTIDVEELARQVTLYYKVLRKLYCFLTCKLGHIHLFFVFGTFNFAGVVCFRSRRAKQSVDP